MEISWMDRVQNEEVLHGVKEERNTLHTTTQKNANLTHQILRTN
jgi:hypothetical protein